MENVINKNQENEFKGDYLNLVRQVFGNNISCSEANHVLNTYTNFLHDDENMVLQQLQLAKIIIDGRNNYKYEEKQTVK